VERGDHIGENIKVEGVFVDTGDHVVLVLNIQVERVLVDRGDHIVPNIQVEGDSYGKGRPHCVKNTGRWGFL
jgi:hypothetical protein